MKINHRIAGSERSPFWLEIRQLGVAFETGTICVLNITEDDPRWPEVERLCIEHRQIEQSNNIFTADELSTAQWLTMFALGHHGYPQPDDDFGYLEATYDLSHFCPSCSIGKVQKAPFRLRAEPKASHSQFIQLNWVFDEFFVRGEARSGLLAGGLQGIEFVPAVLHRNGQSSDMVWQMKVDTVLTGGLYTEDLEPVTCKPHNEESKAGQPPWTPNDGPYCGRVKYHAAHKGALRFARQAFEGAPDVVKTTDWFGSGASAFRFVVVSQRFRRLVLMSKWRGVGFEPVELVD